MGYPTRIYYTEADKALMWDRWQKGESLNEIGRYFGRSHSSIQNILSQTGGIRPPERKRLRRCLSLSAREEISRGVVAGRSIRPPLSKLSVSEKPIHKPAFVRAHQSRLNGFCVVHNWHRGRRGYRHP